MIRSLVKTGSTVLLTTQYLEEADQLADRIAVMDRGQVVAEGTADELKTSVGTSSLQLRVLHARDIADARHIVEHVLQVQSHLTAESGKITAPMKNADQLADLLIAFRTRGIPLVEISVQKPTLDEVFMSIIGHRAAQDAPPESERSNGAREGTNG